MPESFDVAIVGGGMGGYVAAIRAAQLGARAAIIEKDRMGGTCLVRGCIPTKALLQSSELYSEVGRGAEFGVMVKGLSFDMAAAQRRKAAIVDQLVKGVEGLMRSNDITLIRGHGVLQKGGKLAVGKEVISAKNVVVATGSVPSRIPIKGVEHTLNSDQILELKEVPKRVAIIGGGVVGMEFGAFFAALGSEVTVLEMLPQILPMVESDMVNLYRRQFDKLKAVVHTEAKVEAVAKSRGGLQVSFSAGGESQIVAADVVLLAAGRSAYTDQLGITELGVEMDGGRVKVDDHLRTSVDGVYAVGDVIGGIMLAHVAAYEGAIAAENICGADRTPDYHAAPNCIYTEPEIAHVGLSEREAREQGIEIKVGRFPFSALGRAMTLGHTEGQIKVVADAGDETILGVWMVGHRVTDTIAEATLAVQNRLKLHELDLTIHAHPTLAEGLHEAALAASGIAIHIPNRNPAAIGGGSTLSSTSAAGPSSPKEVTSVARDVQEKAQPQNGHRAGQESPDKFELPAAKGSAVAVDADPAKLALKKENRARLMKLHRMMVLIRRFEERAQEQYTKAKIGGYCHLNLGEEATVVGGIAPLKPGDYIYTSYREHGHAIARGVDPKAVMAELFGRETGTSHGRGGSMHMFNLPHRFMGGYGIVGGHLPLATGAGFAIKYQKAKDIVFCMFGDGATNIGAFHESLNFAKVFELPVVWFCVNNQYGMGTAVDKASAVSEIYKKACAYDMESIRIDGNNLLEVLIETGKIVEKTRHDSQPRFIEAVCYRAKGHSVVDPDKYRDDAEKKRWLKADPVAFFENQLKEARLVTDTDLKKVRDEIEVEVEEIVKFAGLTSFSSATPMTTSCVFRTVAAFTGSRCGKFPPDPGDRVDGPSSICSHYRKAKKSPLCCR